MNARGTNPGAGPTAALRSVGDEEGHAAQLEVRLYQALEGLNAARAALGAQPEDFRCATEVMRRVHMLRDLRARCELQRARVAAARAAAGLEPFPEGAPAARARPHPFRKAQAGRADVMMAALARHPRTCPVCQAPLPVRANRCHCRRQLETPDAAERAGTARTSD